MAIEHTEGGTFIDTDPIAAPDGTPDDPDVRIYPYAYFRSLEHVAYGLYRTAGGPKDEEIDSVEVGEYGMEPLAQYWEFGDALKEVERGSKYAFEETPFVEVETEEQYDEALDALADEEDEDDEGDWQGPGLYDFRDYPPSYQVTVEEDELRAMEDAADQAFDFMFQGDEWKDAYNELANTEAEETE